MNLLDAHIQSLQAATAIEIVGTVIQVQGLALRVADLPAPIGAMVQIGVQSKRTKPVAGQIVGFDHDATVVMPLASTDGIGRGDKVAVQQFQATVPVGNALLGRVVDGLGQPIDGQGPLGPTTSQPLHAKPMDPMDRPLIDAPLSTGVRAIDALLTIGKGQRMGIFASPGVGKSVLLGQMGRNTSADVCVIGLVGERGREVKDFVHNNLGQRGMERTCVVVATSDESALLRLRAAQTATAVAEHFRDQGADVLLMMDSVTRFCHAQRQVGLAAGEPPATRGYPPSVFAMLPSLLERSGRTHRGSITGLYTVLTEGDDMSDPVAEACRGVLDGHILLAPKLAAKSHWPAIDVLRSISRCADDVITKEQRAARQDVLRLVNAHEEVEDLINIGAYAPGSNVETDLAIACKPSIDQFLQQSRDEKVPADAQQVAMKQLRALGQQISTARLQLAKNQRGQHAAAAGPGR